MQINYLSHFLLILMLDAGHGAGAGPSGYPCRKVTGNDNTVGGGGVYPIADLKELEGLKAGAQKSHQYV